MHQLRGYRVFQVVQREVQPLLPEGGVEGRFSNTVVKHIFFRMKQHRT